MMFGKRRKQDPDEGDYVYDQPVSYWRGNVTNWINRMRDFLYLWFRGSTAIMVVRIRKDRRQDHAVFIPETTQQNTINWGQETYDIEEEAIIRDNGRTVMYVIEGCRKPVRMSAWRDVCQSIADKQNTVLGEFELSTYGNVSVSSRDAYTKMNNRDAEILMRAGQNRYSEYSFYLSAVAAVTGVVLVGMMLGLIPSGMYGSIEGMYEFLLSKATELETMVRVV